MVKADETGETRTAMLELRCRYGNNTLIRRWSNRHRPLHVRSRLCPQILRGDDLSEKDWNSIFRVFLANQFSNEIGHDNLIDRSSRDWVTLIFDRAVSTAFLLVFVRWWCWLAVYHYNLWAPWLVRIGAFPDEDQQYSGWNVAIHICVTQSTWEVWLTNPNHDGKPTLFMKLDMF